MLLKPRKITLGQARKQGDVALLFYCENGCGRYACRHNGEMRLRKAIERWGENLRLDQVPARCTRCGGADVDVRARTQRRDGGHAATDFDPSDAY